jgi:CubicO group peptidase (beta-lactamase class C family)
MRRNRWFTRFFLVCVLVMLGGTASRAAEKANPPEGHWDGTIDIPGAKLQFDVDLDQSEGGAWSGDISIPAQGAKDLLLSGLKVEADKVSFAIPGIPGDPSFAGTLAADGASVSGTFTQGGQSFPFSMKGVAKPADRARGALEGYRELVEGILKDFEVPGVAIGIVVDGEVVLTDGYGFRDVAGKKPMTAKTLLAIGSCTKAFTVMVLGTLVDEGKLDWDKPVQTYIPSFRLSDRVATELLTPRDMVTHRSGLPRHDLIWYNANLDRKEMVSRLAYLELSQPLRAKFQYNNLMFMSAGYLAEVITGKSWEESVRTRIFEPLGMSRSNFSVVESQKSDDFALPYEMRKEKVEAIPFRVIDEMGPAGSINSSVEEMSKWLMLQLGDGKFQGKAIVQSATLAEMHSPQMPLGETQQRPEISQGSYGMGWIVNTYRGHQHAAHSGGIDGFTAEVELFPQDGFGMVVLTNRGDTGVASLIAKMTADRVLGLEPIDWKGEDLARYTNGKKLTKEAEARRETVRKKGTTPAHKLEEYAGTYEHPGYGTLQIDLTNGKLVMIYNRIHAPLEHWHYEVFKAGEDAEDPAFKDHRIQFQTDMNGDVASVASPFEPTVKDIVFTRKPDAKLSDPAVPEPVCRHVRSEWPADDGGAVRNDGDAGDSGAADVFAGSGIGRSVHAEGILHDQHPVRGGCQGRGEVPADQSAGRRVHGEAEDVREPRVES